jgi:AraC-like DNA-binding protein
MLPPPPPFPYRHQALKDLCDRLSTVLQPWNAPGGTLQCHWVSSSPLPAHTTVSRHTHRFFEGFLVLRGTVSLITPWETQSLEPGSLLFLSPGTVHQWQTQAEACHWLVLSCDLDHHLVTPTRQAWPVCPELLWTSLLLCDTVERAAPGWPGRANAYLGVVYAALISLLDPAPETPVTDATPQLVTRIDELLRDHLTDALTLDELAAHVAMSARHLSRRFRQYTGMTIHERLEALRLERAAQLLRRTNLPVIDVAHAVGITNAAYFAQRFRQRFDASPKEFRQQARDQIAPPYTSCTA